MSSVLENMRYRACARCSYPLGILTGSAAHVDVGSAARLRRSLAATKSVAAPARRAAATTFAAALGLAFVAGELTLLVALLALRLLAAAAA